MILVVYWDSYIFFRQNTIIHEKLILDFFKPVEIHHNYQQVPLTNRGL
jgi:hypothetical protein